MYLYLMAAIAIASAFGSWQVQEWRYGSIEAERAEQQAKEQAIKVQRIDQAAVALVKSNGAIRKQAAAVTKKVDDAIQTDFYAAGAPMCLDDAGLLAVTEAVRPAQPASRPAGAVPGPEPTHWWQPKRNSALDD